MISRQQERYVRIGSPHEILPDESRSPVSLQGEKNQETGRAAIIAVGGAKEGIGKSAFVSSLSVCLSQKGFKTVVAALDLDTPGRHPYLGKPVIKNSINAFLSGRVTDIRDVLAATPYGPGLIGGDNSQFGTDTISFTKKLMLLQGIRKIAADYVIIDLGGAPCCNVLDFFLAADLQIIMTTCEPDSCFDAFSFISAALYRKICRLHGKESLNPGETDPVLNRFIHETEAAGKDPMVGDTVTLMDRIKNEHPKSLNTIKQTLFTFTPRLIVNKAPSRKEGLAAIHQIREWSRRRLSVKLASLDVLPHLDKMEKHPHALFSPSVHQLIRKMVTVTPSSLPNISRNDFALSARHST